MRPIYLRELAVRLVQRSESLGGQVSDLNDAIAAAAGEATAVFLATMSECLRRRSLGAARHPLDITRAVEAGEQAIGYVDDGLRKARYLNGLSISLCERWLSDERRGTSHMP